MQIVNPAIKRRFALSAMLALAVTVALFAAERPHVTHATGATIFVTTTADENVDNGSCSFREAIIASNTNAFYKGCRDDIGTFGTNDQIQFLIGITGHEIDIGSTPLPPITEWVTIDGHDTTNDRVIIHGPGGPLVSGANGLTVASTAFGTTISSLVINNSADDGILIQADDVTVTDSFIGTDEFGQVAVPNQGFGIQVQGGQDFIGPHHPPASGEHCGLCGNLIAGNLKSNILLDRVPNNGPVASGGFVHENQIGTTLGGGTALPGNKVPGVEDKGSNNTIGGTEGVSLLGSCTGVCNQIAGNGIQGGILLDANATNTIVEGNFIGTDSIGKNPLPNTVSPGLAVGIVDNEPGATIGGEDISAINLISGNAYMNLDITGLNAIIPGNFIGTKSNGTEAMVGNGVGIFLDGANGAQIGTASGGNLISGNSVGVEMFGAVNAKLLSNGIGIGVNNSAIPNSGDGVQIRGGSNNVIVGGLQGAGNYIAHNGGDGVDIDSDTATATRSNTVRQNSIYANGGKGIDLQNGANDGLAPPVITGKNPLTGTSCAMCVIDIYSDDGDEGRIWEASMLTNNGNWTFDQLIPSGPNVTATATDISNNTSRFSTPFVIFTPTPSPTPSGSPSGELDQGDVNCSGLIDIDDFNLLIEYAAGLNDGSTPPGCPDLNEAVPAGAIALFRWGDVNCDNAVNALDALYVLRYVADVPLIVQNCVPIGGGAR